MTSIKIPETLDEWTFPAIRGLLQAHAFEDGRFDWKEKLPDRRDPNASAGLLKTAIGLANSRGGFLIFGVSNDASLDPEQRIVGVAAADQEFEKRLADQFAKADPTVPFQAQNPPLLIPGRTGVVLHVVEILDMLAPHSHDGVFYRRTSGGSREFMGTQEVREMFSLREEKRRKLRMLLIELAHVRDAASAPVVARDYQKFILVRTVNIQILAELQADLMTLLLEEDAPQLSRIRATADAFNGFVRTIWAVVKPGVTGLPGSGRSLPQMLENAYSDLSYRGSVLRDAIDEWIKRAVEHYGETAPAVATNEEILRRSF
jgi:hypothetical protein